MITQVMTKCEIQGIRCGGVQNIYIFSIILMTHHCKGGGDVDIGILLCNHCLQILGLEFNLKKNMAFHGLNHDG